MSGSYGFTCGWCDAMLDTPFDDSDHACEFAQKAGWRMVWGVAARWGEGAHNTCPNCAEGDESAIPIWTAPRRAMSAADGAKP